jgi:hypothetical protein
VQSALNEVGSVQGVAGYSAPRFWTRDTGVIMGNLRVHLEPWFAQALTTGGRKGRPSRLDGMREPVVHVLKGKIHGLGSHAWPWTHVRKPVGSDGLNHQLVNVRMRDRLCTRIVIRILGKTDT